MIIMKLVPLFFIIVLVSCSNPASLKSTSLKNQKTSTSEMGEANTIALPLPSSTITPTFPLKSSPTEEAITNTLQPSSQTPTISHDEEVNYRQLTFLTNIPAGTDIEGTLVLIYPYSSFHLQIELVDMKAGSRQTLLPEGHSATSLSISPDRKWLAYEEGLGEPGVDSIPDSENTTPVPQNRSLVVVAADGQERIRIPYQPDWGALSRWLTNETLIIRRAQQNSEISTYTAKWLLNPFTNKRVELPPDPKDLKDIYPPLDWGDLGMTSYNQTLTRRVYPVTHGECCQVLEELPSQKEVARIRTHADVAPEWSPDGQQFAIKMPTKYIPDWSDDELFSVNVQGDIKRLTYLVEANISVYSLNYTWSPDGQMIAFWVQESPRQKGNDASFATLDLTTGMVTIYPIESSLNAPPRSIWSPDGKRLLVGTSGKEGEKTFLVDLNNSWAVEIAEKEIPGGWLLK